MLTALTKLYFLCRTTVIVYVVRLYRVNEDFCISQLFHSNYFVVHYFAPGEVQSIAVIVSVCLSMCESVCSGISKTAYSNFANFLYILPMAVAQLWPAGRIMCYVFLVLWMTSCFYIIWGSIN